MSERSERIVDTVRSAHWCTSTNSNIFIDVTVRQ